MLRPTPRVELRAGVGGGAFQASEGPRVGGIVGQADASVRASDHIGVLLGTRYVVLPRTSMKVLRPQVRHPFTMTHRFRNRSHAMRCAAGSIAAWQA
ncbi:MAG: hypothetical protein ACYC3F_09585 [Gemmatimonadaceae bacterium]